MNDAVGYIRCSHMDAAAMTRSIAFQSERIRLIAAMRFLRLHRVFIDVEANSSSLTERDRMLSAVTWDQIGVIIVATKSRLARIDSDYFRILGKLEALGIEFICADEEREALLDRHG